MISLYGGADLKALKNKGLVKIENFTKNPNKINYIYVLTPKGFAEKTKLTINFMKANIHPENYRLVAFKDMSNNDIFITKSTVESKDSIEHEGVTYPLVKLEISRTSHPYYTGKTKLVDTAGRIDKFKNRYAKLKK